MSDSPKNAPRITDEADVVLIGAGIMSSTLGAMLRQLEPSWTQIVFERLMDRHKSRPPRGTMQEPATLLYAS